MRPPLPIRALPRARPDLAAPHLVLLLLAVPVARAQDSAFAGKGTIKLSDSDPCIIIGEGTSFTKDFEKPRSQVLLPRNLGSSTAEVVEVISDTELRLKKEFNRKATEGLKEKSEGSSFKVRPRPFCSPPPARAGLDERSICRFFRMSTRRACTRPCTSA